MCVGVCVCTHAHVQISVYPSLLKGIPNVFKIDDVINFKKSSESYGTAFLKVCIKDSVRIFILKYHPGCIWRDPGLFS